jgi:PPOX class probable F420-dependent enzyme
MRMVFMAIPDEFHDLFEKQTFAHFSTVMGDGSPHVTPVWVDYDSETEQLLINTEQGRQKERNVRENPSVGVSMTDPDEPYRFVSVRGNVVEIAKEGAVEHINNLAGRYMGRDEYPGLEDEEGARVILRISTDEVVTS